VPTTTKVSIKIFNALGEMISELVNKNYIAGNYEIDFNGSAGLSSGVYFYRIEAGEFVQTRKMVLLDKESII